MNTKIINQLALEDVVRELLMGLTTDGAHHKQFYLDRALRALVMENTLAQLYSEYEWEDGVAP